MKYTIYKLEFQTGVHFGTGALDECTYTFHADQIFSAMYIEALKLGIDQKFYDAVKAGTLLFSDALPYMGQQYMIPKPMIYVTSGRQGESEQKKAYKKLKYLPVEQLDEFLKGSINFKADVMKDYGQLRQQTMAYVRKKEDTLPFRVGTFYYAQGCGLYLIVAYASEEELSLAEELLESLSYTGIGGKKSSGMGKFEFRRGKPSEELEKRLQKKIIPKYIDFHGITNGSGIGTVIGRSCVFVGKKIRVCGIFQLCAGMEEEKRFVCILTGVMFCQSFCRRYL